MISTSGLKGRKSCGCERKKWTFNAAGKRYGSLVVVKKIKQENGHPVYLFRCDCGETITRRLTDVCRKWADKNGCPNCYLNIFQRGETDMKKANQNPRLNPVIQTHLNKLRLKWKSTIVPRTKFPDFTGGIYSKNYMANQDAAGTGPKDAFKIGNRVVYPIESVLDWLGERMASVDQKYENINR